MIRIKYRLSILTLFIISQISFAQDFSPLSKSNNITLRVASYNVHYSSVFPQDDGKWDSPKPNRVNKFKRVAKAMDADIWAFQEVFHSKLEFEVRTPESIKKHMETVTGVKYEMSHDYEYEKGVTEKGGRLLLSRYPILWHGSANGRTHATLIDLPDKMSKQDLLIVNVHFVVANEGQTTQSAGAAKFINEVIDGKHKKNIPSDVMILLCGDFNSPDNKIGYTNIAENIDLEDLRPTHLGWYKKNYYTLGGVGFVGTTAEEIKANGYTPDTIEKKTIDYMFWRAGDLEVKNKYIFNSLIMDQKTLNEYGLERLDISMQSTVQELGGKNYVGCDHFPYFVDLINQSTDISTLTKSKSNITAAGNNYSIFNLKGQKIFTTNNKLNMDQLPSHLGECTYIVRSPKGSKLVRMQKQ